MCRSPRTAWFQASAILPAGLGSRTNPSCSPLSRSSSQGEPRSASITGFKALGELGYQIDLVTYPIGRDVDLPNLRIVRCWRPPFIREVRIGPSLTKVVLDVFLAITAFRLARTTDYDAIHSHEEAGLLGLWLARRVGIPHLYDMHSSLPQQLSNFRYTRSLALRRLFERVEAKVLSESNVIITICQELQDAVLAAGAGDRAFLIENVMGGDIDDRESGVPPADIRSRYGIDASQPLVLYTGTFEEYQGLDLLVEVATLLSVSHPNARVLVVGGEPSQVVRLRERAGQVAPNMVFAGQRPPSEIQGFIEAAESFGVSADARDQYPAQDLLVPPIRATDRGHKPTDAYTGARRTYSTTVPAPGAAVCRRSR